MSGFIRKDKMLLFYALTCILACMSIHVDAQDTGRQTRLFNNNWKFYKGDVQDGQLPSFNDGGWRPVTLPHDWSIKGTYSPKWASATAYLPAGIGWYRKTFTIPKAERSKKVFIQFNGVYENSEVWINGHFLGKRPNGFITFRYDMTPYLNFGGKNVLAVRVDHSQFADSRWYTGSGIYRNVYLIVTNRLHISQWGVFASTPDVNRSHALLKVNTAVINETNRAQEVEVENLLFDEQGKLVAKSSAKAGISSQGRDTLLEEISVPHPDLWSVKHPALYRLQTTIKSAGKVTDEKNTYIGIRSFRFDADKGFFLNGVNMKLKGVCLHDDAGALGVAVPADVWKRRLKLLKAAGVNAIRLSHNPHAPELYNLCDRMGFLLIDEAFDEWELGKHKWIKGWNVGTPGTDGYHEYFDKWADKDLRDMILRDRNHPSVIMWSIGNEIDYPNDPYTDPILNTGRYPQIYGQGYLPNHPSADTLGKISRRLVKVVKKYDTTRPVTAALAAVVVSNKVGYAQALDVVGYNYQEYRYQEDHKKFPDRKIYGSENGMTYDDWKAVKDNDFVAGQFLWTGIDYLGEAGKFPLHANTAGLLNLAGFRKPEYYFRQSIWTNKPMIYIGTTLLKNNRRGGSIWAHKKADPVWNYKPGENVMVNCFTNCDAAELFLNGKSLGRKKLADFPGHVISWKLPWQRGELLVKGYNNHTEVCEDTLQTYGPAYKLRVTTDVRKIKADGQSVAHVVVSVVDRNGVVVYDAANEITCKVTGPGRLLGLENGDPSDSESYASDHRKAYEGKLLAYIQSAGRPGVINVMIESPELGSKSIKIMAK